jgi:transposase-like protein
MSVMDTASTSIIVKMVTLSEFARLMDVCPNTVRRWIREEKLRAGEHFFRDHRVLRFPWGTDLVSALIKESASKPIRPRISSSGRRKLKYRT